MIDERHKGITNGIREGGQGYVELGRKGLVGVHF